MNKKTPNKKQSCLSFSGEALKATIEDRSEVWTGLAKARFRYVLANCLTTTHFDLVGQRWDSSIDATRITNLEVNLGSAVADDLRFIWKKIYAHKFYAYRQFLIADTKTRKVEFLFNE